MTRLYVTQPEKSPTTMGIEAGTSRFKIRQILYRIAIKASSSSPRTANWVTLQIVAAFSLHSLQFDHSCSISSLTSTDTVIFEGSKGWRICKLLMVVTRLKAT
ncbi:hypothetical protein DPMN_040614 [Dreissena polymorpha]|uniref:Uncharacterized protein n=1 Tax=Dreissena polymorpha TaxID=45954 RepID=A0A9D4CX30_DREPO|nr:hypothetical protein DPMN_040614 [Dreissena polymorpha]